MTYAELYGNIKKRPLKCGLANKMVDVSDIATTITQSLENTTLGMGDAIADMTTLGNLDTIAGATVQGLENRLQGI